jgi:hypothetical protein
VRRRAQERRRLIAEGKAPTDRPRERRRSPPPRSPFIFPGREGDFAPLVLGAIDSAGGACDQAQIVNFARANIRAPMHEIHDRVGDALGELFQRRAISTKGECDARVYFRREAFTRRY